MEPGYLQAQSATIPFVGGVDSKSDPKAVQPPKLLQLGNASFFAGGEISKDRGYPLLTASLLGGGALSVARVYRAVGCNGKQILFADRSAEQYVTAADRFAGYVPARGIWATSSVETTGLNREFEGDMHDYAVANGYELIVTYSSVSSAYEYSIRERATHVVLYSGSGVQNAADVRGAAFATGNTLGLVSISGANVSVLTWDTTAPNTAPAIANVAADGAGNFIDAFPQDTNVIAIAFQQAATGHLKVLLRNVATGTTTATNTATVANIDRCLTVACLSASNVFVVWGDSASGLHGIGLTSTLTLIGTAVLDATTTISHVTAIEYLGGWAVVYRDAADTQIHALTATNAAVRTLLGTALFDFDGLAHRAIRIPSGSGAFVFGAVKNSTVTSLPESYYVTILFDPARSTEVEPLAWYLRELACATHNNQLSNCQLDGTEYRWSAGERQNVQIAGTGWAFTRASSVLAFRIDDGAAVPYGSTVAFGGGVSAPDHPGVTVQANMEPTSFPFAPMISSVAGAVVGGGLLTAGGTYSFVTVFEYVDTQGNVVQSEPSLPVSVTLAGGQNAATIVVHTPYCRSVSGVTTWLYRTQNAGTVHTRDTLGVLTALTARTQTITSTQADSAIAPNAALYTDGGTLENSQEPHGRTLVLHQDRAWKIDEHSGELRYTREILEGEGLAWNSLQALDLRNNGIDAKALVSTNNGLWVFGKDLHTGLGAIQFLVGDGPNDSGLGSSYALQRLEGVTVSCYDQRHCVASPAGVLFWDPSQGFHLLQAQQTPVFVGADVQRLMPDVTPSAMTVLADRKEVRIVCDNVGVMPVWHYDVRQWSIRDFFTTPANSFYDACLWGGQHVVLGLSGTAPVVHQQSAAAYNDSASQFFPLRLDTAWIKTSGFKGLQRIWTITLLGRSVTPFAGTAVQALLYFDYDASTAAQTVTWSEADTLAAMDDSGNVALEIKPNRQVCESFRLHLEDFVQAAVAPFGGGIAWTAIRIDYGTLQRRTRQVAAGVKG